MSNILLAFSVENTSPLDLESLDSLEIQPSEAADFLLDESRMQGLAERVFLPRSERELAAVLRSASGLGIPVTLSSCRTGITGGAVPLGGWLISFRSMQEITGLSFDEGCREFHLKCMPGASLENIMGALEKMEFPGEPTWPEPDRAAFRLLKGEGPHIFPPDPTERTAGLGGMVACNASGARTLFYGPTRDYVTGLRMVLVDGSVLALRRGEQHAASDGMFQLVLPDGTIRTGRIPRFAAPGVKNAAGYYSTEGMDLLDLFIGSEGTLAAFSEIEVRLVKMPETILGVVGFFPSEVNALAFVRAARGAGRGESALPERPMALEFFDFRSLDILREEKTAQGAGSVIPALPVGAHTAVYVELAVHNGDDARVENAGEALLTLLESCGSSSETAWTAFTNEESERLKAFRHALPEAVNRRVAARTAAYPGLTKLGTDFAVPDGRLEDMIALYRSKLDQAGFEYVIFGHIGNNHLHVNILPRDMAEYEKGKALYLDLARQIVEWGGTVSAEHGIGKLKKALLRLMAGDSGIAEMAAVKEVFDPACLLNRGNLF